VIAIRPEDIIPHGEGERSSGESGSVSDTENTFDAKVETMEFLGSFWRVSLSNPDLGNVSLATDMSINVVRHMDIALGKTVTIELPANRLWVFPPERA
jgi:iron(III) transport system ATP-binding protein